ncbi:MAG: hypothetical protein ACREIC_12085 [Limisphaerales bacterium]
MQREQPYIAIVRQPEPQSNGGPAKLGRPKETPGLEEMVKVASLFYKDDLTRAEISKQLDIDPRKVSWLLEQAKHLGIVQITIHDPVNGAIPAVPRSRPEPAQQMLPLKPSF